MDVAGMFQTWINVTTSPRAEVFEAERQKPNATLGTALLWIVIAALIAMVLNGLQAWLGISAFGGLGPMLDQADLSPEVREQLELFIESGASTGAIMATVISSLLGTIIGFLVFTAILYVIARIFGGTGDFGRYAYLIAAFQAPLTIVSSLLGFAPFIGGCLVFFVWIYQLVLTVLATRVEHNLDTGRAIGVIVLPVVLLLVLGMCLVFGVIGVVLSVMNQ